MRITINGRHFDHTLKRQLGIDHYSGQLTIDLSKMAMPIIDRIEELLTGVKEKGATGTLRAIKQYKTLIALDPETAFTKAKTTQGWYSLARKFFAELKAKRFYVRDGDHHNGYLLTSMRYEPRSRVKRGGIGEPIWWETIPAKVIFSFHFLNDSGLQNNSVCIEEDDFMRRHPLVVLAAEKYTHETPELRAEMEKERETYNKIRGSIGLQLRGTGFAQIVEDDNDNDNRRNERRWGWADYNVQIDKDGPAPLVVDMTKEEIEGSTNVSKLDMSFWDAEKQTEDEEKLYAAITSKKKSDEDEDEENEPEEEESELDEEDSEPPQGHTGTDTTLGPLAELPIHPWLLCFNLRQHNRIRLSMRQTEVYQYDVRVRDRLVIDVSSRMLIEMLLHQREQFKDIIAKKGGGAVILCAGPPGVGKTLTSEVFAESEKRPLYSVQCSQLGTSANELEANLLKIFHRAQRWNAILLLDEADVYIAKRGNDLNQNAIVGVFLRVLEYYNGVMFMTTNRASSVDDAVLSRCVARIDYTNPSKVEQARIWHILAEQSGLKMGSGVAERVAETYSLSGRDVKQLLKLAGLVSYARKLPTIDFATIEYCMKFKPTEKHE